MGAQGGVTIVVSMAHSIPATQGAASGHRGGAVREPHLWPSLWPQTKNRVHYHIAVIINYLGHCVSLVTLLVAFVLFLRLR